VELGNVKPGQHAKIHVDSTTSVLTV
jgi:hypothetical protein